MAYPLFGLLITAVICKLVKMHKRPSMIQQYQNTATESTANGKITNATSVAIATIIAGLIIGSISQSVSTGLDLLHYPLIVFRFTRIKICSLQFTSVTSVWSY